MVVAGDVELEEELRDRLEGVEERCRAGDVGAMLEYLAALEGVERAGMLRFQVRVVGVVRMEELGRC